MNSSLNNVTGREIKKKGHSKYKVKPENRQTKYLYVTFCPASLCAVLVRVVKESGQHSTLQGREQSVFNQTNIGTVSRATLGSLLRDGAERVWAIPSATMPS